MIDTMALLHVVLSVFAVIGVGAGMRRLGLLNQEADQSLLSLVINVLFPCLIFGVIAGNPRMKDWQAVGWPPIVGFVSMSVGTLLAALWARWLGPASDLNDPPARRTFALCVGMFNYGYIPLPLVMMLFDESTVGVLLLHNIGVEMALWTVGMLALTGGLQRGWARRLVNPPVLAILAALTVNFTGVMPWLPDGLVRAVKLVGPAAVPMGLLMIGATAADYFTWGALGLWGRGLRTVGAGALLRLAVIPALMVLAATQLPMPLELKRVVIVEAAMPAAVFPIVMARHFGGDVRIALRVIIGSSALALVTALLWLRMGLWLLA